MDEATEKVVISLGMDPSSIPVGSVKLLNASEISRLGNRALSWSRDPNNTPALAYAIDNEFETHVGVILRNLHPGKLKAHLTITRGNGPFWHSFVDALPAFYDSGVAVLVEGPKDARILWSYRIAAAAYLGSSLGKSHLKVVRRYVSVALWIPDCDPPTKENQERKRSVKYAADEMGLRLVEFPIPLKDPADLVNEPSWFERITERIEELERLL